MAPIRRLDRIERSLLLEPRRRPQRLREPTIEPGERARLAPSRTRRAYLAAATLPFATAMALLPVRGDHGQVVALLLVLPVVLVGSIGSVGPALVAACTAGVAYDLAFTQPYWHLVIDDPDDIVTTATLVIVAVCVGTLCAQLVRARSSDTTRLRELDTLTRFSAVTLGNPEESELSQVACSALTELLGLHDCHWQRGYRGGAGPVILPTGALAGRFNLLEPDRAVLPAGTEIPVEHSGEELGRFVLTPDRRRAVSFEERKTALAVVALFAGAVARHCA